MPQQQTDIERTEKLQNLKQHLPLSDITIQSVNKFDFERFHHQTQGEMILSISFLQLEISMLRHQYQRYWSENLLAMSDN